MNTKQTPHSEDYRAARQAIEAVLNAHGHALSQGDAGGCLREAMDELGRYADNAEENEIEDMVLAGLIRPTRTDFEEHGTWNKFDTGVK